jgi:hypothetical protein
VEEVAPRAAVDGDGWIWHRLPDLPRGNQVRIRPELRRVTTFFGAGIATAFFMVVAFIDMRFQRRDINRRLRDAEERIEASVAASTMARIYDLEAPPIQAKDMGTEVRICLGTEYDALENHECLVRQYDSLMDDWLALRAKLAALADDWRTRETGSALASPDTLCAYDICAEDLLLALGHTLEAARGGTET